jgi:type I restriction enzyme S subunit
VSKWEMVRLGEVCEFINGDRGKNYPSAKDFAIEGIPFVNAGHISNHTIDFSNMNYITEDKYNKLGSGKLKENDIIYCLRGSLGKHALVSINTGAIASSLVIFRANTEIISNKYLSYCMDSKLFYEQQLKANNGSSQPNLSATSVKQFEIPLPPLETQKQIAKKLDTASELLAMRKKQLAQMDNLIKSIFYDMFGDPVTNEKGWEIKIIAEIAEQKLSYGSGASAVEYDGASRYIRITDINDNGSLNDNMVSPSEISEKYTLNDGDILFARTGATVGKTLRYTSNFGNCMYAGYLIRLIPNKSLVLPDYVYYFTKTDYYKRFIESNMKTVAQPNINAQQYGELKICVPPMSLQNRFASVVSKIEEQKALVKRAFDETYHLLNSLMSEYFE